MLKTTHRLTKRQLYAIAGTMMLICVIAVTVIIAIQANESSAPDDSDQTAQEPLPPEYFEAKKIGVVRDKAQQALEQDNDAGVEQAYSDAIKTENTTVGKVKLRLDQAETLFNAGKHELAFAAGEQAFVHYDDKFLAADLLARLYEQHGDLTKAVGYYQVAGQWAESSTNTTGLDKAYYDQQVVRINTKQGA